MKNLLEETRLRKQEKRLADAISLPISLILIALFSIIKVTTKLLVKFKLPLFRIAVFILVLNGLVSFFIQVAEAPKANAEEPYQEHYTITLPVQGVPDLKLRETVLALVAIKFGRDQVDSFDHIVMNESGWNLKAVNKNGGACGLFQSLPCSKMKSMELEDQLAFGFSYIKDRYETPNKAWAFWKEHNWY